mmetsp:Transcript_101351/g.194315  ORF Transcript_101351/g.194315 Transcript_101351/m.194315 type:complete len:234 (+) Transcript_101351:670-1371(+)
MGQWRWQQPMTGLRLLRNHREAVVAADPAVAGTAELQLAVRLQPRRPELPDWLQQPHRPAGIAGSSAETSSADSARKPPPVHLHRVPVPAPLGLSVRRLHAVQRRWQQQPPLEWVQQHQPTRPACSAAQGWLAAPALALIPCLAHMAEEPCWAALGLATALRPLQFLWVPAAQGPAEAPEQPIAAQQHVAASLPENQMLPMNSQAPSLPWFRCQPLWGKALCSDGPCCSCCAL